MFPENLAKTMLVLIAAALFPVTAAAGEPGQLTSHVYVERSQARQDGNARNFSLVEASRFSSGDRLVYILEYSHNGPEPAENIVIVNPLPRTVIYTGESHVPLEVSVDNGRSWGRLADLRVSLADGSSRPARAEDVTHLRWHIRQKLKRGESRRLSFRAIVR